MNKQQQFKKSQFYITFVQLRDDVNSYISMMGIENPACQRIRDKIVNADISLQRISGELMSQRRLDALMKGAGIAGSAMECWQQWCNSKDEQYLSEAENYLNILLLLLEETINMYSDGEESPEQQMAAILSEMEAKRAKFEEYGEQQKVAIDALKTEIEKHMPGATSVGLATTFSAETKILRKKLCLWTCVFVASLVALVLVTVCMMLKTKVLGDISMSPDVVLANLLKVLSVTGPFIWGAIFAGARRSETNRLYHEYLHKRVVANSFSSYERQVRKLGEENQRQEVLAELLRSVIRVISRNPADSLDKRSSADMPVNKLAEAVREGFNSSKGNK